MVPIFPQDQKSDFCLFLGKMNVEPNRLIALTGFLSSFFKVGSPLDRVRDTSLHIPRSTTLVKSPVGSIDLPFRYQLS